MAPMSEPATVEQALQAIGATREAVRGLEQSMTKLVELNERQIVMQNQAAEQGRALERAFNTMREDRARVEAWIQRHEEENRRTADSVTWFRGWVIGLGLVGGVVLGMVAYVFNASVTDTRAARIAEDASLSRRIDANTTKLEAVAQQVQEIRLSNKLRGEQQEVNRASATE